MESTAAPRLPVLCITSEDFLKHDYDFVIVGGGTQALLLQIDGARSQASKSEFQKQVSPILQIQ